MRWNRKKKLNYAASFTKSMSGSEKKYKWSRDWHQTGCENFVDNSSWFQFSNASCERFIHLATSVTLLRIIKRPDLKSPVLIKSCSLLGILSILSSWNLILLHPACCLRSIAIVLIPQCYLPIWVIHYQFDYPN